LVDGLRASSRRTIAAHFRILPQVVPPQQLISLADSRILERKTRVESTVVLILEHTSFHDLGGPEDLPGILRNVSHDSITVICINIHVIQLVDIQRRRFDATHHLLAITTQ
jgi:hypothetical protein